MTRFTLRDLAGGLVAATLLAACGGGGSKSISNAGASNVRYAQTMTVTFSGQGLDTNVLVSGLAHPGGPPRAAGVGLAGWCTQPGSLRLHARRTGADPCGDVAAHRLHGA